MIQFSNISSFSSLFSKFLQIILASLFLSSCSVYKSQGRNQFETAVPGKLQTQSIKDSTFEDLTETKKECWLQPSGEALWHFADENHQLLVKTISEKTIEVCEVTP